MEIFHISWISILSTQHPAVSSWSCFSHRHQHREGRKKNILLSFPLVLCCLKHKYLSLTLTRWLLSTLFLKYFQKKWKSLEHTAHSTCLRKGYLIGQVRALVMSWTKRRCLANLTWPAIVSAEQKQTSITGHLCVVLLFVRCQNEGCDTTLETGDVSHSGDGSLVPQADCLPDAWEIPSSFLHTYQFITAPKTKWKEMSAVHI